LHIKHPKYKKNYTVREEQIMLDSDLALFYGVETNVMNRAVKRNNARFPIGFMFQLTDNGWDSLRLQNGTSNDEPLRSQYVTSKETRVK
jgi:hypothetical protein